MNSLKPNQERNVGEYGGVIMIKQITQDNLNDLNEIIKK